LGGASWKGRGDGIEADRRAGLRCNVGATLHSDVILGITLVIPQVPTDDLAKGLDTVVSICSVRASKVLDGSMNMLYLGPALESLFLYLIHWVQVTCKNGCYLTRRASDL
jgi:hypothetical protein